MKVENDDRWRWDLLQKQLDDLAPLNSPNAIKRAIKSNVNKRATTRFRLLLLTFLALFLVWEVLTRSAVAYLADVSPGMAIRLRSTDATALLNLAEDTLRTETQKAESVNTASGNKEPSLGSGNLTRNTQKPVTAYPPHSTPREPGNANVDFPDDPQIRSWAEFALFNDPLNARAFGILGRLAIHNSDDKQTAILMQAAMRRSLHEEEAIYWTMGKSYREQDYAAAISYADTLLRIRPQLVDQVAPVLGAIAESSGEGELKKMLAVDPPWRSNFFYSFLKNISDARTPLDLLLSLKETRAPPRVKELQAYLNFLISHGLYDLAYYTWLQFLSAEELNKVSHLFNGSFEVDPTGLPFDWVFIQGSGVTIEVAPRPDSDNKHALHMQFGPGRVDLLTVQQLIMLPPGTYQLKGTSRIDVDRQRGLQWRITCESPVTSEGPATSQVVAKQELKGAGSGWSDFTFSFSLPDTKCPAQYVQFVLDAPPSEQFISGSIWLDDLEIVRETVANHEDLSTEVKNPK